MAKLVIETHGKDEVVDVTDVIARQVGEASAAEGMCLVFAAHTTCAVTTADLDPGTDQDLLDALRAMAPQLHFRHPHDPAHAPDHILASLIGPSVTVPYAGHRLLLGTWQRIVLVELDGPRRRTLYVECR